MVGQDISLAQAIASRKGYTVRDFSGFEMTSPPSGSFNIDLRGEWQLYVFANSAGKVSRIELMENAYAPKAFRVDHSVRSFDVGPAKFEREELRTLTPKKN